MRTTLVIPAHLSTREQVGHLMMTIGSALGSLGWSLTRDHRLNRRCRVLVIDDECRPPLDNLPPFIQVVRPEARLGVSGARSLGCHLARKSDVLLLADAHMTFYGDTLKQMVKAARENVAIIQPRLAGSDLISNVPLYAAAYAISRESFRLLCDPTTGRLPAWNRNRGYWEQIFTLWALTRLPPPAIMRIPALAQHYGYRKSDPAREPETAAELLKRLLPEDSLEDDYVRQWVARLADPDAPYLSAPHMQPKRA